MIRNLYFTGPERYYNGSREQTPTDPAAKVLIHFSNTNLIIIAINNTFRIVWSQARQAYVVAHEKAASSGRPSTASKAISSVALLALLTGGGYANAADYTVNDSATYSSGLVMPITAGSSWSVTSSGTLGAISQSDPQYPGYSVYANGSTFGSVNVQGTITGEVRYASPSVIIGGVTIGSNAITKSWALNRVDAIYNAGSINSNIWYGMYLYGQSDNFTNSGVISNSGATNGGAIYLSGSISSFSNTSTGQINGREYGLRVSGFSDGSGITSLSNAGTISGAYAGMVLSGGSNVGIGTLNNVGNLTGTASGSAGLIIDGSEGAAPFGAIVNASNGTISGLQDGLRLVTTDSAINQLTNLGAILGSTGYGINNEGTINTLNNAQGGLTPLTYSGVLPSNYKIILGPTATSYGKLVATSVTGQFTFGIYSGSTVNSNRYVGVLQGITASNITGPTTGTYNGVTYQLVLEDGQTTIWDLLFPNYSVGAGPSAADTFKSLLPNAVALRNAYNIQSAKIAQGLAYDCTVYDQRSMCVAFAGGYTTGNEFGGTVGALIIAHKPNQHFRFGGYMDQSWGSSTFGGLTTRKANPGYGLFGVWSQNAEGSGIQVRGSANVGQVDIETTREVVDTAEAGFGKSDIKSYGVQLEVSRLYVVNPQWTVQPYVGYRKTTNQRAAYTEAADITAPLSYSSLKQSSETLTAGATFAHPVSAQTTLFLRAGVEHDLTNQIDAYAATNSDIGAIDSIDMSTNTRNTRPTVSFAVNHNISKTERVGFSLEHRTEAFQSGNSTAAFVQYTMGF